MGLGIYAQRCTPHPPMVPYHAVARHCIRKCGKPCAHDRAIICKGRKGFGLALYVARHAKTP